MLDRQNLDAQPLETYSFREPIAPSQEETGFPDLRYEKNGHYGHTGLDGGLDVSLAAVGVNQRSGSTSVGVSRGHRRGTPARLHLERSAVAAILYASRENAAMRCARGAIVRVFPGGDHVSYRPTLNQNVIDFNGRRDTSRPPSRPVPIVPVFWIGGQETQFFLTRGNWPAKRVGLKRLRVEFLPVSIGLPFGLTTFLGAKAPRFQRDMIRRRCSEPVDVLG